MKDYINYFEDRKAKTAIAFDFINNISKNEICPLISQNFFFTDLKQVPRNSASESVCYTAKLSKTGIDCFLKITVKDFLNKNGLKVESQIYNQIVPTIIDNNYSPCIVNYYGNIECNISLFPAVKEHFKKARDDSIINILITELSSSLRLKDLFKDPTPTKVLTPPIPLISQLSLLFQLFWTLTVFKKMNLKHNDLHFENIFVEKMCDDNEVENAPLMYFNYNNKIYSIKCQYFLKIYDFDRSSANTYFSISRNYTLDYEFCEVYGQCNTFNFYYDIWYIITRLYNSITIDNQVKNFLFRHPNLKEAIDKLITYNTKNSRREDVLREDDINYDDIFIFDTYDSEFFLNQLLISQGNNFIDELKELPDNYFRIPLPKKIVTKEINSYFFKKYDRIQSSTFITDGEINFFFSIMKEQLTVDNVRNMFSQFLKPFRCWYFDEKALEKRFNTIPSAKNRCETLFQEYSLKKRLIKQDKNFILLIFFCCYLLCLSSFHKYYEIHNNLTDDKIFQIYPLNDKAITENFHFFNNLINSDGAIVVTNINDYLQLNNLHLRFIRRIFLIISDIFYTFNGVLPVKIYLL
jgi:hypothetical protein